MAQRGNFEAVWTLGIRGIHDQAMQGPPGTPARMKMVDGIIVDQRQLIDTKVTRRYPAHVVADWLGNTPEVADRHYLQTTEAHFRRAVAGWAGSRVVQGVVQQSADPAGMDSQTQNAPP